MTDGNHKVRRMNYLIPPLAAILILNTGLLFIWFTERKIEQRVEELRNELKAQKTKGQLPFEWNNIDLDHLDKTHLMMRLTSGESFCLDLADFFLSNWIILIIGVFAVCYGIAFAWKWFT